MFQFSATNGRNTVEKTTNVYKEVWDTLSAVDVSDHTQEKGGLTYLSWAWAWGVLMEHYPDAEFEFSEEKFFPDGSCQVECEVSIRGASRSIWLAVMDYRNNAIENPNARNISDTRMRCLVKCLAIWGLGHYIYAGEDVPSKADASKDKEEETVKTNGKAEAIEVAERELGAKEVPGWKRIVEARNYEELTQVYRENSEEWKKFGDQIFGEIVRECTKRKQEFKKGDK